MQLGQSPHVLDAVRVVIGSHRPNATRDREVPAMPHVSIRIGVTEDDDRAAQVLIDGVDITKAVMAEGFAVEFEHTDAPRAVVSMRLMVDRLDMDLPDAVLNLIDTPTEA